MKWSTETKVGAFAFVGIILFSGMMFELSSMVLFGKKGFEVTGCFTEAEGIEPGNPIHYVGVEVGRVDKVAVKNGEAVLTLRFYDGSEVPVDAEFSVQESSIMGGKYIKVNGGHLNNGILKSGAVIHGDGGNTINTAMNKLDKLIDTAQIMVNGINAIVADPNSQGSVKSTLRNVDLMTQNLAFLTEQGIAIANEVDTMAAQMNSLLYQFNGDGKAVEDAKKNLIHVPRVGTTIPHEVNGHFGAGKILIMPAKQGTGVIAGGPARAVLELAGLTDVRAKSLGSNNPRNMVNATINGLASLRTAEDIAKLRGKTVEEILG